jgi:CheY-like chemotaxis protein
VELARKPLYLADIVARAIEMVDPLLEQRGHRLDLDVPRGNLQIHADDVRMTQVVGNLLTNAAKYTPPGGAIRISAARDGDEVVLHVEDNGNGIPAELLPRVFEMFVQGRRSSDRSEGGLGLGLALVRSLVEMQGGKVTAHSRGLGAGAEFIVRLPALAHELTLEQRRTPLSGTAKPEPSRRVLIVDDNVDAAQLLAEFLRLVGHDVALAYDGAQALSVVRSYRPDVAVLDIGLPVMDGYELAAQLRQECVPVPYLVALTGYGQEHDRDRAQRAGFDEHLVKPVDTATLLRTVRAAPLRA